MPQLPPHPDLDQLRHQAKDLLRAARSGDTTAVDRLGAVSPAVTLAAAQLAIAREYGFGGWPALKEDVERRTRDLTEHARAFCDASIGGRMRLASQTLAEHPELPQVSFLAAVILGDPGNVSEKLSRDPGLATRRDPESGWTALHAVCSSRWARVSAEHAAGTLAVARLLLEAGAPLTARNDGRPEGWSPLRCAVAITNNGPMNEPVLRLLLDHGAGPEDHDLYLAGFGGEDHTCLRLLLDHTPKVAEIAAQALAAPLSTGDIDGARLLLEAGADPSRYADDDGNPCAVVHAAVTQDCAAPMLELLLAHGADPNAPGLNGRSPFQVATARGRADLTARLVAHSAVQDASDIDALLFACRTADRARAQQLLAAHPAILQQLSTEDDGALAQAAERNDISAATLMLDLGFPTDTRQAGNGATALHTAGYAGAAETVELLLARGADLEARDGQWGATPIEWAIIGSGEQPATTARPHWERVIVALLDAGASTEHLTISPDDPKPPSPQVAKLLRARGVGNPASA